MDVTENAIARKTALDAAEDAAGVRIDEDRDAAGQLHDAREIRLPEHLNGSHPGGREAHPLAPGLKEFRRCSEKLTGVVAELKSRERDGRLTSPLKELAFSYVHMRANRLLRNAPRRQELIIYDMLARHYESQTARGKS